MFKDIKITKDEVFGSITIIAEYLDGSIMSIPNDPANGHYQLLKKFILSLDKDSEEYKSVKKQMNEIKFKFED